MILQRKHPLMIQTLDTDTQTVTIETDWKPRQVVPWVQYFARYFCMRYLVYDGIMRHELTNADWVECYLMCNGYGEINLSFAYECEWDWSHVRDSSFDAFVRIAHYIMQIKKVNRTLEDMASEFLRRCIANDLNPFEEMEATICKS